MTNNTPLYSKLQGSSVYARAVLLNVGIQLVVGIVLEILNSTIGLGLNNIFVNIFAMLLIQCMLFIAIYSNGKERLLTVKQRIKFDKNSILLGVLLGVILFVGFVSSNMYFSLLLEKLGYNFSNLLFDGYSSIILGFIVICLIAPIIEELIFRFALLEGFKDSGIKYAIILSAMTFSLMHMSPEQTFYQFALGIVAALFVIRTGNLLVGIVIHMFNNIVSFVLGFIPSFNNFLDFYFVKWYAIPISISLAVIAIYVLFLMQRYLLNKQNKSSNVKTSFCNDNVAHVSQDEQNINSDEIPSNYLQYIKNRPLGMYHTVILLVLPMLLCIGIWIMQLFANLS